MKCNNCGKELKENSRFCTECGASVGEEKSTNVQEELLPKIEMPKENWVNSQEEEHPGGNEQTQNVKIPEQQNISMQPENMQILNQQNISMQPENMQIPNQQNMSMQPESMQIPNQQNINMQGSNTQPEQQSENKNKKKKNIGLIIATSVAVLAIVACVVMCVRYVSLKNETEQAKVGEVTTKEDGKQEQDNKNVKETVTTMPTETPFVQREDANIDITAVDNSEFPKVTLYFSVTDLQDQFLDLDEVSSSRFSIYERQNGSSEDWKQVQTSINYHGKQGDSKKSVAFVMDTSGSMDGSLEAECEAADVLLDSMEQDGNYSVAFTAFSTEQHDWLDYTRDYSDFRSYMNDLAADGETAFYDTLVNTLNHALYQNGQKYILAFTDGEDTNSVASSQQVLEMAKAYKIPIYIITMSDIGNGYLYEVEEIAKNSGGGLYTIDTIDDLQRIYYNVFELQNQQYSLTYESTQTSGYSDIQLQFVSDEYEGETEESYFAEKPKHYYAKPEIEEVRASSECKPMTDSNQKKCTYDAENVCDGDNRTAWVEGKSGDGIGEYLKIKLKEESSVNGILISNGYYKNTDVYYRNNRVKKVKLTFSDGSSKTYKLEDDFLDTCDIVFDEPVVTSTIKVEILSVYKSKSLNGKKAYKDTCITELEVY